MLSFVEDYVVDLRKEQMVINPLFSKLKEQAEVGDLIIINSNNFMSSLFKKVDNCEYSSFKVVVRHGKDKLIMVSDIDNLSDEEGFYLSDMQGFFSDYDQVQISLWHPKFYPLHFFENLQQLKRLALQNNIPYDFSYNFRSDEGMSCIKLVQKVYGLEVFKQDHFNKFPYYNPLMCDVQLGKFFNPKMGFFPFWVKK